MKRHIAVILVAVLAAAGFAFGFMRPAHAAPAPAPAVARTHPLVCMWNPLLINLGVCEL